MNAFYDDFPLQTLSLFLASVIPGEEFAFCAGKKAGCKTVPDNPIKPLVYEVQPYRALHPKPLQGFRPPLSGKGAQLQCWERVREGKERGVLRSSHSKPLHKDSRNKEALRCLRRPGLRGRGRAVSPTLPSECQHYPGANQGAFTVFQRNQIRWFLQSRI